MTTNFELAASFAPTLPISLLPDGQISPSLTRLPEVVHAPRPTLRTDVRLDLIASLRRQIAAGTYRVSAMQLADSMLGAIYAA